MLYWPTVLQATHPPAIVSVAVRDWWLLLKLKLEPFLTHLKAMCESRGPGLAFCLCLLETSPARL